MKVNSEELWAYVNDLGTYEKVKFKVYYADCYTTDILWNGENFEWESGKFTSEAFFNPLYDFIPIEEEKEIEEIIILTDDANMKYVANKEYKKLSYSQVDLLFANKFNEIIKEVNKLKKEGK